jgi:acyl-CoA reductase-like NAD-dependent aldehyde dehydrogenase
MEPVDHKVTIAGAPWATGDWDEVRNPWDGSLVGRVPRCGADEVDAACTAAAAVHAGDDLPAWRRAEVLDGAAGLLSERSEEFTRRIVAEAGKPIRDARGEVARCLDTLRFSAVEARRLVGEMIPLDASRSAAGRLGFSLRVPVGVVAAITPFNFPLNLVAHKLGPAVAAGCPVVLKPAEQAPLSALALVEVLVEAGLPADWISVVTGDGPGAGVPLVVHDVPAMVSFTGSVPAGHAIAAAAPRKRVALELGANSPVIVEPDADLELVVSRIRQGGFSYSGQSCISTQRVLVHDVVRGELTDALVEAVGSVVTGDPADEATEVGPLISTDERDRVRRWLDDAVATGGRLLVGGDLRDGVLAPTVVADPPPDSDLVRREVFGPVVTVSGYQSFDDAVALANDSDFGLHCGVFTRDLDTVLRAARRLDFGGVIVNDVPTFRADQQPYGGTRDSGTTREGPAYAVQEMTDLRTLIVKGMGT